MTTEIIKDKLRLFSPFLNNTRNTTVINGIKRDAKDSLEFEVICEENLWIG